MNQDERTFSVSWNHNEFKYETPGSIMVDSIGDRHGKEWLVDVVVHRHWIVLFVPELPRCDLNSFAFVLPDDHLDHIFVPRPIATCSIYHRKKGSETTNDVSMWWMNDNFWGNSWYYAISPWSIWVLIHCCTSPLATCPPYISSWHPWPEQAWISGDNSAVSWTPVSWSLWTWLQWRRPR